MQIRGWRIDGFGIFHDAVVEDLPAGLTVVAGPNEAGKSTLLAFLRGVLFGFPDGRSRGRRHEPVRGGRHGGAVTLAVDDGSWTVERYADPKALVLRRPDGTLAEDHELTDLLGHADATLFGNVFAFGLSELDGFELLDSDAVRDRVFSAGVVGAGRSAREALDVLDARRTALVRPRGRCEVRDLADEARAAARALAQAQATAADLVRRRDDVDRLGELADRRREAIDACRAEQHRLRSMIEVWPVRSRLAAIDDELDDVGGAPDGIDDEAVARFEQVRAELTAATLALEAAELELTTAIERRDATVVDPSLAELGPTIRSIAGELAAEETRTARLAELDREVDVQRGQLEEQLHRLGPDWDRSHLDRVDLSIPAADEVRRAGGRLAADEARLVALIAVRDELIATRDAARDDAAGIEGRLSEVDPDAAREEHERQARSLRQLRASLVDLGTATARLDAADRTVVGLQAVMPKAAAPTSGATLGTGLVAVGIVLLLLAGAASFGGAPSFTAVLAGSGAALAVLGAAVLLTRRSVVRPDATTRDLTAEIREAELARKEARAKVATLRTSVEAAALVLGLPADPSALDVEDRAAAVDAAALALREDEQDRARRGELLAAADDAAERLSPVETSITTLTLAIDRQRAEWAEWKAFHRVPEDLGLEAINDLFTTISRARTTSRSLQHVERERAILDEASNRFRASAADLLRRAGVEDDGDDLLVDVRVLVERGEADGRARRAREEHAAAVAEAEARIEAVYDRVAVARAAHAEMLAAVGADDDGGFRAAVQAWRRRRELSIEADAGRERIHAALGHGDAAAPLLAELDRGDPAGWEAALDAAIVRLPELEAQHEDAIRMHHDAARALEELSRSADVPDAALRVETVRTRLAEGVAEWQRLTAARHLIAETLARYERERQPAVLARAEEMFAAITDGHYRTLSVVDGDLTIVDAAGRRLTAGDLSRGTAEQLYLCVRFGLAAEMADRSPLPFVMDDVLVNFDPERMARMAGVIAELATAHQVLVFTCQPSSLEALRAAAPAARVIELPRHGGRA